jgi:phenylalanine-4-hydroxylase
LKVLDEFANSMAYRKGGTKSVEMAVESNALSTCQLSSGIQISGIFSEFITDSDGEIAYLRTKGPTMLSENDKMLIGHGKNVHKDGFGTPIGRLDHKYGNLEDLSLNQLAELEIEIGERSVLKFQSGVIVEGILQYVHQNIFGKILIMGFIDCTVILKDEVLFKPDWGSFDMAVGNTVKSVFSGAADKEEFESESYISPTRTNSNNNYDTRYINLYQSVRNLRETGAISEKMVEHFEIVKQNYPNDWLLSVELYELAYKQKDKFADEIKNHLLLKASTMENSKKLILDGIRLIEK